MAGKQTLKGATVVEYCKKYPDKPKLWIAKKLHADHPKLFPGVETARKLVVAYTSETISPRSGGGVRAERYGVTRKAGVPGENAWKGLMPPTVHESLEPWHLPLSERKVLVMSDVHLPYHSEDAVRITIEYALKEKPDSILLNGDVMDMASASFHEKDPRVRDLNQELESTRAFFRMLRTAFPKIPIRFRGANHEARLERYLMKYAEILLDTPEFKLENLLRLAETGVEYIAPQRPMYLGKLTVLHGDEYKGAGGVNPARWLSLRTGDSALVGHFHRTSTHIDRTVRGDIRGWWSTGCLCSLDPNWLRFNQWNQGFAMVNVNPDGSFEVENLTIVSGRVR